MTKTIGVFAHFDPDGIVDENTIEVLRCLAQECDEVEFITTSQIDLAQVNFPERVTPTRRPNIGYDFYSYKVGLTRSLQVHRADQVFLVNSSFLLLDRSRFSACLKRMKLLANSADAIGASASQQMGYHLQSYLLLLGPAAIKSPALARYIRDVQPQNTKIDLILNYEIGLSRALSDAGLRLASIFQRGGDEDREANPVHTHAHALAEDLGIVKTEVLRDNQHGVATETLRVMAEPGALSRIDDVIARYKQHYVVGSDRMTSLKQASAGPPDLRFARWGRALQPGVRIAVVVHIFYADLADEFCASLSNIIEPFDVYITTPFDRDIPELINRFARIASSVTIAACENRGRDIGPFVSLLRTGALNPYVAVLKLHSKKSRYSPNGDQWRSNILAALIGTSYKVLCSVDLVSRSNVGLVGPHDYYLTNEAFWGSNQDRVRRLVTRMKAAPGRISCDLGFFAGSMFWFKPAALSFLQELPTSELDFEPENGAQDGTLAHAIERAFGPIVRAAGYSTTTIYLDGREIHDIPTRAHSVPVL